MSGVRSILEVRKRLTSELEQLDDTPLYDAVAAMRSACRKFLNETQHLHIDDNSHHYYAAPSLEVITFFASLGSLRAIFGLHIALLASRYQIDIEEELASILPAPVE